MREIKFRAWNYYDEKMCEVIDLDFKNKSALLYSKNNTDDPVDEVRFSFEDIELMQFTGLKDKNGRDIYEGDVVKCVSCSNAKKLYEVVWLDNFASFALRDKRGENYRISIFNDYEVIGNIYENKELLEKSK